MEKLNTRILQLLEDPFPELTKRQSQVARLASKGYSFKEAATELNLSYNTVRNHHYRALEKLGADKSTFQDLLLEKIYNEARK